MKIINSLKNRRSFYNLGKDINISDKEIIDFIEDSTELIPDAFNMKSSRVYVVMGHRQDELWDRIYDEFNGKVPRDKIDGFKNAYGTILYFYDGETVKNLQEKFPSYKENFPKWAIQSSAMLQISIWTGLRELGLGANLQHYNPVIDDMVKDLFDIPKEYILNAQMPFGNILDHPEEKERENISNRVKVIK